MLILKSILVFVCVYFFMSELTGMDKIGAVAYGLFMAVMCNVVNEEE